MSEPVADAVWLVRGAWVTMILRCGCELGIFDALGEPRTAAEVATALGTEERATARYLRVLLDIGLVATVDGGFVTTELGSTLRSDHPSRVCDLVLMQSDLTTISAWHELADALRTGAGTYEPVNGVSHWGHLAAHPDEERVFNAAMARRGTVQADVLLGSGLLDGVSSLVDVGGGRGAMLAALLEARPGLTGVVADRPSVADEATAVLASRGLADRGRGAGCDFFVSVPTGGEVYSMAHVLHDWTDEECVRILGTVRLAMGVDARLLVLERVVDTPGRGPKEQRDLHIMDLHMLVLFGARERTLAEYDRLLTAAGFTSPRLHATGDWNVLEARPAGPDPAPE
jgi:hypothetical protein